MSGIIKAGQWQSGAAETLQSAAFNLEDMSDKARNYLDAIRTQAARILAQAKGQAQLAAEAAKQQGRQAALQEATQALEAKLDQKLQTVLPALEQAITSIRQAQQAWLKHWEGQTIRLATAIAERIIRRKLQQSPEITRDLVREALELSIGGGRVRLHLHPQDHDALKQQLPAIAAQINLLAPADIIADPDIRPGGCRVVTEFGMVDQQIESQLARIEEELTDATLL
jgi:flagellar assembly protein FliH